MARRRDLLSDVKRVVKQDHASSLIPATFLVVGLLDLIPIPTDAGYFYVQRWLECNRSRLTKKQLWMAQYANYYGWDATWYLSLFALTYFGGNSMRKKLYIGGAAISIGALATLFWKATHPSKTPECDPAPEIAQEIVTVT